MTLKKDGTDMGKKKPYGKIAVLIMLALMMAFAGLASAEQQFYPGFVDKEGEMGTDGKSWRIGHFNTIVMEGTSDTSEFYLRAVTVTADRFVNTPDASGTMALTETIGATMALGNATMLVGNIGGLGVAVAHTLTGDVTGTMTNAGGVVTTIGNNKVGTAESNLNTVTLSIPGGSTTATVEVETGSTFMGWYIANYGAINAATIANAPLWVDPNLTVSINGTDGSQQTTFGFTFMRP